MSGFCFIADCARREREDGWRILRGLKVLSPLEKSLGPHRHLDDPQVIERSLRDIDIYDVRRTHASLAFWLNPNTLSPQCNCALLDAVALKGGTISFGACYSLACLNAQPAVAHYYNTITALPSTLASSRTQSADDYLQ